MEIDKGTIVNLLRERGDQQRAEEAERDLPGRVDTERDAGLLDRFGLDPQELVGKGLGGRDIPGL